MCAELTGYRSQPRQCAAVPWESCSAGAGEQQDREEAGRLVAGRVTDGVDPRQDRDQIAGRRPASDCALRQTKTPQLCPRNMTELLRSQLSGAND